MSGATAHIFSSICCRAGSDDSACQVFLASGSRWKAAPESFSGVVPAASTTCYERAVKAWGKQNTVLQLYAQASWVCRCSRHDYCLQIFMRLFSQERSKASERYHQSKVQIWQHKCNLLDNVWMVQACCAPALRPSVWWSGMRRCSGTSSALKVKVFLMRSA